MEVDAILVNGPVNCLTEQAPEESLSHYHPNHYDALSDSEKFPRVGKRYQVEIPPPMPISSYYKLQKSPYDIESTIHGPQIGSTIPLFWTEDEVDNMHDPLKQGIHEKNRGKGHCLAPGSSSNPWNEKEEDIFTLGLYIFRKSFAQIKRFIGNKTMGDILSYYYEKFCKSGKHQRWHQCKNSNSMNCIFGEKIFQPPSQQKLLSRLRPNVTQECYITILEVSWLYAESKMELEDYVLALKDLVGLNTLVEAVGIGKREDLTGLITTQKFTKVLPKIPVGKDCSRITHREIIDFLTHFTLSKARASDIFWEAVWPRLLARGWHSEQQQGSDKHAVASSHNLLFFVPGVKMFSRKLEKGNHYFDSTSDILEKVVSNPEIIELPTINTTGNGLAEAIKLDCENSPDQKCHYHHHKPHSPHCRTTEKKFTIVDTSMGTAKVIELRCLPVTVAKAFVCMYVSDDVDTQEEQANASRIVDAMCLDKGKADSTNANKLMIGKGVPSEMNTRRKIARTRLPTTKVLEALESEEYPKENRKRRNYLQDNSMPTPSRHTRPKVASETPRSSAEDFQVEEGSNVACDGSRKL